MAVRSGNDSADRYAAFSMCFSDILSLIAFSSVKSLEGQITELESECKRLSRALEAQKAAAQEAESLAKRKVDDAAKEIGSQVGDKVMT